MKYSSIIQGPRLRKTIDLPRPGASVDPETGAWCGPTLKLDVRPLRPDEHDAVIAKARAYAIERGGTTLRDFVGGDGQPGYFQQELFVYGRGGAFCKVCGSTLREVKLGQRASVYCPRCQR